MKKKTPSASPLVNATNRRSQVVLARPARPSLVDRLLPAARSTTRPPYDVVSFSGMQGACPSTGYGELADGRAFYVRCRGGSVSVRIGHVDSDRSGHEILKGYSLDDASGWIGTYELIGLTRRLLRFTPAYRLETGVFEPSAKMVRKALRDGANPAELECAGVYPLAWERRARAYVKMRQFRLRRGMKRADGGVRFTESNIAWVRRYYEGTVPERIQALTPAEVVQDPEARSFFAQIEIQRMQEGLIRCEQELSDLREIVGLLKKAGAYDPTAAMRAARRGDYPELTTWLAQGYNLNAPVWKGYTPLALAIFRRDLAGLSWLLAHGASPAQVIDYHSYPWSEAGERVRRHGNLAAWKGALTPLCLATLINWPAGVGCLLAQGARPDQSWVKRTEDETATYTLADVPEVIAKYRRHRRACLRRGRALFSDEGK